MQNFILSLLISNGVKVYLSLTDIHDDDSYVLVFERSYADIFDSRDDALDILNKLPEYVRSLNWCIEDYIC